MKSALPNTTPVGIYFHWPFCLAKCPYCDFNVHVQKNIDHQRWTEGYLTAIKHYAQKMPGVKIRSVFFGGGTPSLMPTEMIREILESISEHWLIEDNCEITLEANPTSVEAEKFAAFKAAGINRVSLGIQALNDKDLKFLGRKHNLKEALQALEIAGENFERFSFDLIYARPGQNLKDWELELLEAVKLAKGHLSLYQLTIERSTSFFLDHAQGKFKMPGEELAADFYNLTQDILEAEGLPAYEVSNHAAPGEESRHNLIYWHYGDYIGIGPGAHGRLTLESQKHATRDHSAPEIWLQKTQTQGHGAHPYEKISPEERFMEALMMGLRLREGCSLAALEHAGGKPWQDYLDEKKLGVAVNEGWANLSPTHLILTREGILRLNALVLYLLKD